MNQFQFVATISERDVLRYTPAGVPIVSATLSHSSQQVEAGVERLVEFEMAALAAGDSLKDPAAYVRRLNKLLVELSV